MDAVMNVLNSMLSFINSHISTTVMIYMAVAILLLILIWILTRMIRRRKADKRLSELEVEVNEIRNNSLAFKFNKASAFARVNDDVMERVKNLTSKYNTNAKYTVIQSKKAVKPSGYSSSQMNTKHKFDGGKIGNGELQIRGSQVNDFADVEHIPYDIRKGKITRDDTKYSGIYNIIKRMSKKNYNGYNQYLSDVYKTLRMKELGLLDESTLLPSLSDYIIDLPKSTLDLIDANGLSIFVHK